MTVSEYKPEKINERIIKFTGDACIDTELINGHNYTVAMYVDIVDERNPKNEFGGFDKVYVAKCTGQATINGDNGEIIKCEKKKKKGVNTPSQQLRWGIEKIRSRRESNVDSEAYYNETMKYLLDNLEDILYK